MSAPVPRPIIRLHRWIWRGLVVGGSLAFALIVSGALWGILALVGDQTGAAGARCAALGSALAGALDVIALVALLAWDRVSDKNNG